MPIPSNDLGLSGDDLMVFRCIRRFAMNSGREGCQAGIATISRTTGVGQAAVRRIIGSLERGGIISVVPKGGGRGNRIYMLVASSDRAPDPRAEAIARLKAMPYDEYLLTPHWDRIRKDAYRRAGHACDRCGRSDVALHAHHLNYDKRGEEEPEDVVAVCPECHADDHPGRPGMEPPDPLRGWRPPESPRPPIDW